MIKSCQPQRILLIVEEKGKMVDTLLAPHFLGSGGGEESYLDFYHKLIQHQRTNLLVAGSRVLGTLLENDEVSSIKIDNKEKEKWRKLEVYFLYLQ